jgi:hypothetical protein
VAGILLTKARSLLQCRNVLPPLYKQVVSEILIAMHNGKCPTGPSENNLTLPEFYRTIFLIKATIVSAAMRKPVLVAF